MNISSHHRWQAAHIAAAGMILMAATFLGAVFLPFPNSVFEELIYRMAIVPYGFVMIIAPELETIAERNAFATGALLIFHLLTIYGFFIAIVVSAIGIKRKIALSFLGAYVVLSFIFDKLHGHLF